MHGCDPHSTTKMYFDLTHYGKLLRVHLLNNAIIPENK